MFDRFFSEYYLDFIDFLTTDFGPVIIAVVFGVIFVGYHALRGHAHSAAEQSENPPPKADAFVSRAMIIVPGAISAGFMFWLAYFGIQG